MKSILFKTILITFACGVLAGCEPEYPKRKKIVEIEAPGEDEQEENISGNTDNTHTPPLNNSQPPIAIDNNDKAGEENEGNNPVEPKEPLANENKGTTNLQGSTNSPDDTSSPGKATPVKNIFVCQNTALISPVSGPTNCFLKKGTNISVTSAKIMSGDFISVVLPNKVEGCTMLSGYFYSPDVSDKVSCDGSIK